MHRCDNLISPWGGRGVGSERTALPTLTPQTQGHGQLTGLGVAGWVLPPVVRRGEGTRSGAPSWTTAQTQAVQGCTVCVVPPDLLPEPREPDAGGRTSGGGLSFGDFSLATQRKVTRPSPKDGRNPFEASSLASCTAKPCHHTTAPAASAIPRNGRLRLPANRPYDCTAQPCLLATGMEFD